MKTKSRAIIWIEDKLVLIKREKGNQVYYVFPGGSVEQGENDKEACIRELDEELGICVTIQNPVFEFTDYINNVREIFYNCTWVSGDIGSGADKKFTPGSVESSGYSIVYIPKAELGNLNLLPLTVRDKIIS
jgi:8-oxo-dGTP pyrophosphatase MutT (NUDIX family)